MLTIEDYDDHNTDDVKRDIELPTAIDELVVSYDRGRLSISSKTDGFLFEDKSGMSDFSVTITGAARSFALVLGPSEELADPDVAGVYVIPEFELTPDTNRMLLDASLQSRVDNPVEPIDKKATEATCDRAARRVLAMCTTIWAKYLSEHGFAASGNIYRVYQVEVPSA